MKLKDIEMIRLAELVFLIGGSAWAMYPNSQMAQEIFSSPENLEFFTNTLKGMSEVRDLFPNKDIMTLLSVMPFYADFLFYGGKLEARTQECQKINELYNKVLANTSYLMQDFYLDSPIAIFSMYVYLYRNGYLSHNHQFKYSMNLKDLPGLGGADIITGNGVCRSIAAFLSDLYGKMGYDSETIAVHTSSESCRGLERLCPTPLEKDEMTGKLVKVMSLATGVVKFPNHLITRVKYGTQNYILDPTNDGILYRDGNRLMISGHDDLAMFYSSVATSFNRLIGQTKGSASLKGLSDKMSLPSIDIESYRKIYLEVVALCQSNPDVLEGFYKESAELYSEINSMMLNQRGLIGRKLPIVPKMKIK